VTEKSGKKIDSKFVQKESAIKKSSGLSLLLVFKLVLKTLLLQKLN